MQTRFFDKIQLESVKGESINRDDTPVLCQERIGKINANELIRFSAVSFLQISHRLVAIRNSFGRSKSYHYGAHSDLSDTERRCVQPLSRSRSVT